MFDLNGENGLKVPKYGQAEQAGCFINKHDYKVTCHEDGEYLDSLERTGPAVTTPCSGDLGLGLYGYLKPPHVQPAKVAYGDVVDLDVAKCEVTREWVRCTNPDNHGFELSKQRNRLF